VKVLGGTGKGAVFRYRVEYLKSAICHGLDKYDLYTGIKAQSSAFGGVTAAPPGCRRHAIGTAGQTAPQAALENACGPFPAP
jgi:hypothetical protein